MPDLILIDEELWGTTRAGARAGRGFRFQDAVAAWLAIEGWRAGRAWSAVVPEGVDDLTLHGANCEIRAQLKSRHDPRGRFKVGEAAEHIAKTARSLPANWAEETRLRVALVLERPVDGLAATGWDVTLAADADATGWVTALRGQLPDWSQAALEELTRRTHLVIESNPMDRAVEALEASGPLSGAAARLAAQQLREQAGAAADANYLAPANAALSLGATEVQGRVEAISGVVDSVGLATLTYGLCEVADFSRPVDVPDFYSGVDVSPAHVGAGLVFERPQLMLEALEGLQTQSVTLVAGPSGSGKSALAWLAAYHVRHAVRWHRVRLVRQDDVGKLVQFAQALDVSLTRPVGFVVDDVGRDDSTTGWDALVREAGAVPGLLLLGTVREEDLFQVRTQARSKVVRPVLDEPLAERVWKALLKDDGLKFQHWQEPFDLSRGLMLEFTHLLTAGRRLEETITEQVRRRLEEGRDDELSVLAVVAFATAHAGVVDADRLRRRLGLAVPRFARALARLIDEHAIRHTAEGGLAGLHEIRSTYLDSAVRACLGTPLSGATAESLLTCRADSLARLVVQILRGWPHEEPAVLRALRSRMAETGSKLDVWVGAFHGLGLATADRVAAAWLELTRAEEIEDRYSGIGLTMAAAGVRFNSPELFGRVDAIIARFEALAIPDLRRALLDQLDEGIQPEASGLADSHELAASLQPLAGCAEGPGLRFEIDGDLSAQPLVPLLEFLGAVRPISAKQADALIERAGGVEALLERIHLETPWVTRPTLGVHEGAISVTGKVRYIAEEIQPDVHGEVVRLCDLMAIAAPQAEWIIADAILADGRSYGFGDYHFASKCMPRANIVTQSRIPWNRALLRALNRLVGAEKQTERTTAIARAIGELAVQLDQAANMFCRQQAPGVYWTGLRIVRTWLTSFIEPPRDLDDVAGPRDKGEYRGFDQLHGFATGIERLVAELVEPGRTDFRMMAFRAKDLAATALELQDPPLWRMTAEDPLPALASIGTILTDTSSVLFNADVDAARLRASALRLSKTSARHSALPRAAAEARVQTAADVAERCKELRTTLCAHGVPAEVFARPDEVDAALNLLNARYLALQEVSSISDWVLAQANFAEATARFPDPTNIAYAPMIGGVIAPFGQQFVISLIPYGSLQKDWGGRTPYSILDDPTLATFKQAMEIIGLASAAIIPNGRPLLQAEEDYVATQVGKLGPIFDALPALLEADDNEGLHEAAAFLLEQFARLQREFRGEYERQPLAAELVQINPPSPAVLTSAWLHIALAERGIRMALEAQARTAEDQP